MNTVWHGFVSTWLVGSLLGAEMDPVVGSGGTSPETPRGTTAFVHVDVVPMDDNRVLRDQTVIVRGERIVDIGPSGQVTVPSGATRIDGRGKYLMPGLAEMHGHTPVPGGDPNSTFVRNMMFLYAANGVTTVRGMLGAPGQLELRTLANKGEIFSPTLYLAGPSFNGNSVTSPEQGAERVWSQERAGWDLLKIHPGLTTAEYDAIANAAAAAGIRFGGHVPSGVGLRHALEMGQATFDHMDGYLQYLDAIDKPIDQSRLADVVRLSKLAGAAVVPTMVLWEVGVIGAGNLDDLKSLPELRYWPARSAPGLEGVDGWIERFQNRPSRPDGFERTARRWISNRARLLKALNDGGVPIMMGTDSPQLFSVPGFSIHREMQAMADAGLSAYDILVSGTRNVGEYFQGHDSFGIVAVGRRADLVLVKANPLDDVAHVADRAGVMVRGWWMSEDEIQNQLEAIAMEASGGD